MSKRQFDPKTGMTIAYTLLAVWAVVSILALVWVLGIPPKAVAHKSDITNALGATTTAGLVKQAEKAVGQSAASSGVTLTSQKVVSVTPSADKTTVVIIIKATTAEYGPINLKITFRKGIYSMSPIEQA